MSSFNVVQVIPALESGGVERGTIDVANYLAELKIHNSIISNGGSLESELNQEFIDHLKLPVHSKNPLLYFNLAKKIQEYIQIKKINLVHVRSRVPAWIVNMMNKKNYKSIATFHNIYSGESFLKKMYNEGLAKMYYVLARSYRVGPLSTSLTGFLVPSDAPGFSVPEVWDKMGQRAVQNGTLVFEDVEVPDIDRVGEVGTSLPAMGALLLGFGSNIQAGATVLGVAQRAYDSVSYTHLTLPTNREV